MELGSSCLQNKVQHLAIQVFGMEHKTRFDPNPFLQIHLFHISLLQPY